VKPTSTPQLSDCELAFQEAAAIGSNQDAVEDLDNAVKVCGDEDEWIAASEMFPEALDGADPVTFLENRCTYGDGLGSSPLCASSVAQVPTNTAVPPTAVPPTAVPPTAVPPTAVPPTVAPPTAVPPTAVPPTAVPAPTQPPVASSSDIVIWNIFADGSEGRNEPDEYAVIQNTGAGTINLSGWRLNAGSEGQDYWFPNIDLGPNQSCRVYTNQIHGDSCGGTSFGSGSALWRNTGDCGILYDASGAEVSRRCY
jgi:hypothetical protein